MKRYCCLFLLTIVFNNSGMEQFLPHELLMKKAKQRCASCQSFKLPTDRVIDDAEAKKLACPYTRLFMGQLALVKIAENKWQFLIIRNYDPEKTVVGAHVCATHQPLYTHKESIMQLKPLFQWLYQPTMPAAMSSAICADYMREYAQAQPESFFTTCIIPKESIIHAIGDLHGDVQSLRLSIQKLYMDGHIDEDGKLEKNHYLVFLGDYSDRGLYSAQVWSILMHIRMLNKNVFILRGNHELVQIANSSFLDDWCIYLTLAVAFEEQQELLHRLFASLPQALLLGISHTPDSSIIPQYKFIQFCHAGIDPTIPMKRAIITTIKEFNRTGLYNRLNHRIIKPDLRSIGLLWTDFFANRYRDQKPISLSSPRGREIRIYNFSAVREYCEQMVSENPEHNFTLEAIVRGHQHVPGGTAKLKETEDEYGYWDVLTSGVLFKNQSPSVYTCTSSPEGLRDSCSCAQDSMLTIHEQKGSLYVKSWIHERFMPAY